MRPMVGYQGPSGLGIFILCPAQNDFHVIFRHMGAKFVVQNQSAIPVHDGDKEIERERSNELSESFRYAGWQYLPAESSRTNGFG